MPSTRIKLYNIRTSLNSQDRLLYATATARDNDFSSLASVTKQVSNFERKDDLTFLLDIYDYDLDDNYNYCIFEIYESDPVEVIIKRYFLFIESAVEKSRNDTRIVGKLDTLTQYMTKDNIDQQKQTFIKRSHINRFVESSTPGYYNFDFDNEELLIKEDFNVEPRKFDEDGVKLYEFNRDEFEASGNIKDMKWLIITTTANGTNNIKTINTVESTDYELNIDLPNQTFIVPLLTNAYDITYINLDDTETFKGAGRVDYVMNQLNEEAEIIDVKIVPYLACYDILEITEDPNTSLDLTHIKIRFDGVNTKATTFGTSLPQWVLVGLEWGKTITLKPSSALINTNHVFTKTLSQITNINYEPKLFQFKKYLLSFFQQQEDLFFDALKNDTLDVKLSRGLGVATEKTNIYVKSGLYDNNNNTGATLEAITDPTIAVNVNQWSEYVANKKISSQSGYAYGMQVVSGSIGSGIGFKTQGGLGGGLAVGNMALGLLNTYLQRQDLKLAPDKSKARGSNVDVDLSQIDTFEATLTIVDILDSEKDMIESFLFQNGYKLSMYKNIYDIIDTRVEFNYIETLTDDDVLTVGVSSRITQDILRQLNNGVRFYKSLSKLATKINTNIERSL